MISTENFFVLDLVRLPWQSFFVCFVYIGQSGIVNVLHKFLSCPAIFGHKSTPIPYLNLFVRVWCFGLG